MSYEDDGVRRLSVQDIALLKQIARWRRSNNVSFFLWRRGQGFAGAYGFAEWNRYTDGGRHNVAFEREAPDELIFTTDYHRKLFRRIEVDSLQQGVDILVAVGVLPARFSSAYRAGWDIGREDIEHPAPSGAAFAAIAPAAGVAR